MTSRRTLCRWAMLSGVVASCLTVAGWAQSPPAGDTVAPTAKAQKVLILGDSLMKGLVFPLQSELAKQPNVLNRSCAEIGRGLARLDLYNWHQEITEQTQAFKPDIAVVWVGGNDNQPLKTATGLLQLGTQEWATEYARRVGLAMDLLIRGGIRHIYWLELPDMRDDKFQTEIGLIRDIQAKEAKLRPEVNVLPLRNMLSPSPGKYRKYLLTESGLPLNVRADDGIHLNQSGCKYIAAKIAPTILK